MLYILKGEIRFLKFEWSHLIGQDLLHLILAVEGIEADPFVR
jgi:hypothetical protein